MNTIKCCERDTDGDGNCPIHAAPGIFRDNPLGWAAAQEFQMRKALPANLSQVEIASRTIDDPKGVKEV